MTYITFTSLVDSQKWEILWDMGRLVDQIKETKSTYLLFTINSFFIEVEFSLNDGKALKLYAFRGGTRLDKYLNKIQICLD